uniref:(northern house mosquito) hypothetical protein n=1 Tax=Culex pipiens TaxID=7175 RepID=A0A8D8E1R4_CULPI
MLRCRKLPRLAILPGKRHVCDQRHGKRTAGRSGLVLPKANVWRDVPTVRVRLPLAHGMGGIAKRCFGSDWSYHGGVRPDPRQYLCLYAGAYHSPYQVAAGRSALAATAEPGHHDEAAQSVLHADGKVREERRRGDVLAEQPKRQLRMH